MIYKQIKIVINDIAYYFDETHLDIVRKSLKEQPTSCLTITRMSNFIVDRRTNTFLKCRQDLESVVDEFTSSRWIVNV